MQDLPTPLATSRHVLVKVHACGVGYRDLIDWRGR